MGKSKLIISLFIALGLTLVGQADDEVQSEPRRNTIDFRQYEINRVQDIFDKYIEEYQIKLAKEEEERLLAEEKARIEANRIYCMFEVTFYTTSPDEGSGTGMGKSEEYVQPWISIALPEDIPFYSTATIEGLGSFINHDTGSAIKWVYNEQGNLMCKVDVCVSTKEEAFALGKFTAEGYIDIKKD